MSQSQSQPDPLAPILKRLASCIRLLLSASPGERDGAVHGVQRIMNGLNQDRNGVDLHALADRIEKSGNGGRLTDEDKKGIRAAIAQARAEGYAEGVAATEAKEHGTGAFRNTDGTLDWKEVAVYCQRQIHRLPAQHHEFINDMAARTVWDREPTEKQHKYLHSLFKKLGGKIT
jgi:hypothetical protein